MNNTPPSVTPSLSNQVTWHFCGKLAAYVFSFLIPVVLVRVFSKNDFGVFQQSYMVFLFLVGVLEFGLRHSLFYFIPTIKRNASEYVWNTILFSTTMGILAALTLYGFREWTAHAFHAPELATLMPLVGLYVLFMLVATPFESILVIQSRSRAASVVTFVSEFFRSVSIVVTALWFPQVATILLSLILFSMIRCGVFLYWVRGQYRFLWSWKAAQEQWKYSLPLGISVWVGMLGKRLEQIIIAMLFTPAVYAVYLVGRYQLPLVSGFFQSTSEVAIPRFSALYADGNTPEFLRIWHALVQKLTFVGIGAFFGAELVCEPLIVLLFGQAYFESIVIFRIFLFVVLAEMLCHGVVLRAIGGTQHAFRANLYALIFSLLTAYPFTKLWGMPGAAISAVGTIYVNAWSQLLASKFLLKLSLVEFFPVKYMATILGCASLSYALSYAAWLGLASLLGSPSSLASLIAQGMLFALSYGLLCQYLKLVNFVAVWTFIQNKRRKLVIH